MYQQLRSSSTEQRNFQQMEESEHAGNVPEAVNDITAGSDRNQQRRPSSEPFGRTVTEFIPLTCDPAKKIRASETVIMVCQTGNGCKPITEEGSREEKSDKRDPVAARKEVCDKTLGVSARVVKMLWFS
jgi:hypothetical protein